MIAIGGDDVVVFGEQGDGADRDGFLACIEMEKAAHFPELVVFQRGLLEAADAIHVPQEPQFVFIGELPIDRSGNIGRLISHGIHTIILKGLAFFRCS